MLNCPYTFLTYPRFFPVFNKITFVKKIPNQKIKILLFCFIIFERAKIKPCFCIPINTHIDLRFFISEITQLFKIQSKISKN